MRLLSWGEDRPHFGCRDRRTDAGLLASAAWVRATLVERAPQLRQGGYMIDFWGVGFNEAEHMGLVLALPFSQHLRPE